MLTVSDTYKRLIADVRHEKELRIDIAGVSYLQEENSIISCSVSSSLFSEEKLSIGGCYSAEAEIAIFPKSTPPTMAEIKLYVRLKLGDEVSEWIPQGVFYIDTRSQDYASGALSLHCYDAMCKANLTYMHEGDVGEWPRSMPTVADEIAARMGVEIDPRTQLNSAYNVEYPNEYTMREILGYIAVAHGGNWYITYEGKLRLVTLFELPKDSNLLIDHNGYYLSFEGVRIIV